MAIRKLIVDSDAMIRKISKPVTVFDENLWQLLDDMKETLKKENGAGLAAVQVGVLKRLFIVDVNNLYLECVNPEIVSFSGSQEQEEGCLSVSSCTGIVKRPNLITVKAYDRFCNEFTISGTDYLAIALSHENDHLDGILFTDKTIKVIQKGKKE